MTAALLDHPWPLDAGLESGSDAYGVLPAFLELTRRYALTPVRFVSNDDYLQLLQRLSSRRGLASATIRRFADHFVRRSENAALAVPDPEPRPPLSDDWKRGLRDAMGDCGDWRNPQIVYPKVRRPVWPNTDEAWIRCSDCLNGFVEERLLICLEEYDSHRFAISDHDPWCHLEHRYPPENYRIQHPCVLPKPPDLCGVTLQELPGQLGIACGRGWRSRDHYHFVPAAGYAPLTIPKGKWRAGGAFELGRAEGRQRSGPIDHCGRVWEWDQNERHWDVQFPGDGYMRISHDGRDLG